MTKARKPDVLDVLDPAHAPDLKRVPLRIHAAIAEMLEDVAKDEGLSMNALITHALIQYLRLREK